MFNGYSKGIGLTVGPETGKKVFVLRTLPAKDENNYGQLAQIAGFSLHAGVFADSHQTDKLERLCRCIARPAISEQRLRMTNAGKVRYELKTPYNVTAEVTASQRGKNSPGLVSAESEVPDKPYHARGMSWAYRRLSSENKLIWLAITPSREIEINQPW